ncbi:iron-sulfur cluster-binding protein-related [Anaeramoeba flamelloides]|uniref:Iron-sulfur cluster-binding protein-related n=1 Tax=Anaeramoeba flamelloides TaxID=1746091 RepID=A0AAV7Z1I9_9EUKA|nr:iron-sulfur cluster-binding protein-related [Anaeramoeba flamelloides]|eukprot:Anaeramoba_flamelloidesa821286_32.p1 GENE.a821286_32~~a821286_32.p1  ORF type:complete len:353 (+),score=48.01 a821286_32:11-1069(+)
MISSFQKLKQRSLCRKFSELPKHLKILPSYTQPKKKNIIFHRAESKNPPLGQTWSNLHEACYQKTKKQTLESNSFMGSLCWNGFELMKQRTWRKLTPQKVKKWKEDPILQDPQELTKNIKFASKFFGSDLVGITEYDPRWTYVEDSEKISQFQKTIVIGIAMDDEAISLGNSFIASGEVALCYSKLAFVLTLMCKLIEDLGYKAEASVNGDSLSIPSAIQAGLGHMGRSGLLINPKYGPGIRLAKIFTNMPLINDKPLDDDITPICSKCGQCAKKCPTQAISHSKEPNYDNPTISNNPGVLKWAVDPEKCFKQWCDLGHDCVICIRVCPFRKKIYGNKSTSVQHFMEKILNK